MTKEEKVKEILKRLYKVYPHPRTALNYTTPLELLVATIMSAQTTDKLVNTLTPTLFAKYEQSLSSTKNKTADQRLAHNLANSAEEEIANMISKVNFAYAKAKNIKAASQIIDEKYDGKVPDNMADLDALPGVARKTANVGLGNAFHKPEGVVVDTHVMR